MHVLELNHVAIHITEVERSCRFFRDVLRLEQIARPAFSFPGAWFRLGSTQELHLIADYGPPFSPTTRNNHFALRVDDIERWQEHLRSVGADFAPKKRRPDGAWQVFVTDPDGHTIELFTPPEGEIQNPH
ncbi:MAG TPA: VOC family protein [Candidatus Dormibacteraeota bacterium]|nr:VOC family protein [Candidatus Dormibacteraeota bacterium]